jgi:tRNA dimethylallyltransferase
MTTSSDQGQNIHAGSDARGSSSSQVPRALIIAGPTASGKSALALALARTHNGVIINADSMQIYRELRLVTARPTQEDESAAPHRLYGVRPAAHPGSVAWWRAEALREMAEATQNGQIPILCGGTGRYFAALTGGLADIPDPGEPARREARALLAAHGAPWLHAQLATADPTSAARLRPSDGQRIARAWEVWRGTGQGIAAWHAQAAQQRPSWHFAALRLDPDRETLRARIAHRFATMVEQGALDEVRALLAQNLPPALPVLRALGVPELAAHLEGHLTLPEAIARATLASHQYTKRQATWFRHHILAEPPLTHIIHAQFTNLTQLSESLPPDILNFLQNRG